MDRAIEKKKTLFSKRNLWIFIVGVIVILVVYNIFFGDKSSRLNVRKEKLNIETIEDKVFTDYIAVIGTVKPIKTIYLDAIEGGRVEDILIDEGNMVEEGDVIMELSNSNLILDISNNEAQNTRTINGLQETMLNMEQRSLNYERDLIDLKKDVDKQERAFENNKQLFENDHISYEEFTQSKESYQATLKKFELFKKAVEKDSLFRTKQTTRIEKTISRLQESGDIVRERIDNLNIKAPVDGELAFLQPELGEVISYGTRIGKINILDDHKLEVEIDEHYISRVRNKLPASFTYSGNSYELEVTKKYPEVSGGRFIVDMEFTNGTPKDISIGQTFRIKLELGESKEAVLIPRGGFYQSTGGQWVYVVDESGDFAYKREIRIGRQNPKYYEVLDGLQPGEKVIVSSYENFNEADKLMLKD
ncbi:MAG: HlyD family efflux transporter periplasmic adaptor subunit [Bacteroidales bacterium]